MSQETWWASESFWRKTAIFVIQWLRGDVWMSGELADSGWKWKWSLALLNIGVMGMTVALLIAGYEQSFVERALGGSDWAAYFKGQTQPWFISAMNWRMVFGWVTALGMVVLFWDMLTIGRRETRPAKVVSTPEPAPLSVAAPVPAG